MMIVLECRHRDRQSWHLGQSEAEENKEVLQLNQMRCAPKFSRTAKRAKTSTKERHVTK
jgi:hypothetical protein